MFFLKDIYIYIYIYIYILSSTDIMFRCIATFQRCFKMGSKSGWLYVSGISYLLERVILSVSEGVFLGIYSHIRSQLPECLIHKNSFTFMHMWQSVIPHSSAQPIGGWGKTCWPTVVDSDPKTPFSKATTQSCRGGHHFLPWIAQHYPWSLRYNAVC